MPVARTRSQSTTARQGSPLAERLASAAGGAALTLCVSAVVLIPLAREVGVNSLAHRPGTRVVAYVLMLLGGLAGAALPSGFVMRRRMGLWHIPPADTFLGHYPLAWLGGVTVGFAALGMVFPLAALAEEFWKILLSLVAPAAEGLSSWVSLLVVLCGVLLLCREVVRLLDREIHRSRYALRPATVEVLLAKGLEVDASTNRRHATEALDSALRIGLGALAGVGFFLHLGVSAVALLGAQSMLDLGEAVAAPAMPGVIVLLAAIGATGGGLLGWKLDRYLRHHWPRRHTAPPGSWYGHTPLAWIGGIVAAKLLSGVAGTLAQVVFVPVEMLAPRLRSMPLLIGLYVLAVLACMLIIGRAAARLIDDDILRRQAASMARAEGSPTPPS
jgi:hypothetical protein